MILHDEAIRQALRERTIIVSPLLDEKEQIGAGSLDVRLGTRFLTLRQVELGQLDPLALSGEDVWHYYEEQVLRPGDKFILHPGQLVLATTYEFVTLPNNIAAQLNGRSSWGRAGLIIATAAFVQPGFRGWITLEMVNEGNAPIVLYPLMRIAQLTFFQTVADASPKKSKYYTAPAPTAIAQDSEVLSKRIIPRESPAFVGFIGPVGAGQRTMAEVLRRRFGFRAVDLFDYVGPAGTDAERQTERRKAHRDSPVKLVQAAERDIQGVLSVGDPLVVLNVSSPDEILALCALKCRGFICLTAQENERKLRLIRRGCPEEQVEDLLELGSLTAMDECLRAAEAAPTGVVEIDVADILEEDDLRRALSVLLSFGALNV